MARRSTETWWRQHWGPSCNMHDPETVTIGRAQVRVDGRAADAFRFFEQVRARHGYDIRPAYPEGDTGTYNCRHIGNDPDRPMSVHAWGCALDANWQTNPDGSRLVTDMPKAMRDDLHALRTKSGAPVFRWGGDWDRDPRTGHSYYDAMHWEIVATPAELATGIIDPHQEDDMSAEDVQRLESKLDRLLASNTRIENDHFTGVTKTLASIREYTDRSRPSGDVKVDGKWQTVIYRRVAEAEKMLLRLLARDAAEVDVADLAEALAPQLSPLIAEAVEEAGPGASADEIADKTADKLSERLQS